MSDEISAYVSETGASGFAVRIVTGRHSLTGDEPVAMGGADLGPNPYQLLASALGECTAMTVRWVARQKNWPLEKVSVMVTHRKGVAEGRTGKTDLFDKAVTLEGPLLTQEQRTSLLDAATKCPVQRTLEGQVTITTMTGIDLSTPSDLPA